MQSCEDVCLRIIYLKQDHHEDGDGEYMYNH